MVYQWKDPEKFPVPADVVGHEIEKLEVRLSRDVEAEDLVQAAEAKDSPLHELFEWDDEIAAFLYRVNQAEEVLAAIVVIGQAPRNRELKPTRLVSERRERPSTVAVTPKDKVIAAAYRELRVFVEKYHSVEELHEVCASVDALLDQEVASFKIDVLGKQRLRQAASQ